MSRANARRRSRTSGASRSSVTTWKDSGHSTSSVRFGADAREDLRRTAARDHVIVPRAEQHEGLVDRRQLASHDPHHRGHLRDRRHGHPRVPVLVDAGDRDVVRDALDLAQEQPADRDDEVASVEHVRVRERESVDVAAARRREVQRDRAAHRLTEGDDRPTSRPERVETLLRGADPLAPSCRAQIREIGPVTRQPDRLDAHAVLGEPLADGSHRCGGSGEPVDHDDADRAVAE
jgi:hypothetical protein